LITLLAQKNPLYAPPALWALFLAAKLDFRFHAEGNLLSRIGLPHCAIPCSKSWLLMSLITAGFAIQAPLALVVGGVEHATPEWALHSNLRLL
jgi:hypothetical protein